MDDLLLAEQLFLLCHDEESGKSRAPTGLDAGYAGAILLDLMDSGLLRLVDKQLEPAPGVARHPLLAEALQLTAASKPRRASHWVGKLPRAMRPLGKRVGQSLVDRGVVDERRAKVLGLFPTTRWPERDPAPERTMRERLHAALVVGVEPEARTVSLLAVLVPLGVLRSIVDKPARKLAQQRAEAIVKAHEATQPVTAAIRSAIASANTAAVAGATTAVIASN